MSLFMKCLTRFAPANEAGQYDRYALWADLHRFIPPNLIAAMLWSVLLAFLTPHSMPIRDLLIALLWMNCSMVIACFSILALVRFGLGSDFLNGSESPVS